jgi:hypothetical protein
LQEFLASRSVELNTFASLDELEKYLDVNHPQE